jgi:hypothetical protein
MRNRWFRPLVVALVVLVAGTAVCLPTILYLNQLIGIGSNPTITNFNGILQGSQNVATFGVLAGAGADTTGAIAASSNQLTLTVPTGFSVGMGVKVSGAGGLSSLSTPAQPTVAATCGGSCTTPYTYQAVALGGSGDYTAASTASASVNNNATLNATANFNVVTLTPVAGVWAYLVFRGNTPIAFAPNSSGLGNTGIAVKDYGQTLTLPGSADVPTTPGAGRNMSLTTTIVSMSGSVATLAGSASQSVSGATVWHDDGPQIRAAMAAVSPGGGLVFFPGSSNCYQVSSPLTIGSDGNAVDPAGLVLFGAGKQQTCLATTTAMAGLPMFKLTNADHITIRDIYLQTNAAAPPLFGVESNVNNPCTGGGCAAVGNHAFSGLLIGSTSASSVVDGIGFTAAPSYDQNNASNLISDVETRDVINAGIYFGHSNSVENMVAGSVIGGGYYGIYANGGTFTCSHSTVQPSATSAAAYIFAWGAGTVEHDPLVNGCNAETVGANVASIASTALAAGDLVTLRITGSDFKAGAASSNIIDDESTKFGVAMDNSQAAVGIAGAKAVFDSPSVLAHNRIGIGAGGVSYNSTFILIGNEWSSASSLTNLGSGTLYQCFDVGGGFDGICTGLGNLSITNLAVANLTGIAGVNTGRIVATGITSGDPTLRTVGNNAFAFEIGHIGASDTGGIENAFLLNCINQNHLANFGVHSMVACCDCKGPADGGFVAGSSCASGGTGALAINEGGGNYCY